MQSGKMEGSHLNEDIAGACESSPILSFLIWSVNTFTFCLNHFVLYFCHVQCNESVHLTSFYELLSHWPSEPQRECFPWISLLGKCAACFESTKCSVQCEARKLSSSLSSLKLFTSLARISALYILIIFPQNLKGPLTSNSFLSGLSFLPPPSDAST